MEANTRTGGVINTCILEIIRMSHARISISELNTISPKKSSRKLTDVEDDPELLKHVKVYMLADYFAIKELEDLVHAKFKARLATQ